MAAFIGDEAGVGGLTRPLDEAYTEYNPTPASQGFESFSSFDANLSPTFNSHSYGSKDDVFAPEQNGGFGTSDGPTLPPPGDMQPEEGFALREWRRQNAIRLEEKEKREKEMLKQIIEEAEEYKIEFYRKQSVTVENNMASNREKEKLFLASREKFHAEAEKNYWRAIAELIPHEVPTIEKRGKKKEEKKPSIVVLQGPKPGKPTDLSRMRHILLKLKHNTPDHMKPKPPPTPEPKKDAEPGAPAAGATSANSMKSATAATSEIPSTAREQDC